MRRFTDWAAAQIGRERAPLLADQLARDRAAAESFFRHRRLEMPPSRERGILIAVEGVDGDRGSFVLGGGNRAPNSNEKTGGRGDGIRNGNHSKGR